LKKGIPRDHLREERAAPVLTINGTDIWNAFIHQEMIDEKVDACQKGQVYSVDGSFRIGLNDGREEAKMLYYFQGRR
jgi:hypothetical protein